MLENFGYVRVKSLKEGLARLADPGARPLAGGTDLLGCLRDGLMSPRRLVSLRDLKPLKVKRRTGSGGLGLGAMLTVAELAEDAEINRDFPALAQAAGSVGSPQLRHQGTLGGNLCQRPRCWYFRGEFHCVRKGGDQCFAVGGENQYHCVLGGESCYIVHPSDLAPALVALGASVHLLGPRGRRSLPLEKFFVLPEDDLTRETVLEPGEIVTEATLPPPAAGQRSSYRKVRARGAWDFALASLALAVVIKEGRVTQARVVLGGAAPVPWRSPEAEAALVGRRLDEAAAEAAAEAALRPARPLEKNAYKVPLLSGLIREQLLALPAGRQTP